MVEKHCHPRDCLEKANPRGLLKQVRFRGTPLKNKCIKCEIIETVKKRNKKFDAFPILNIKKYGRNILDYEILLQQKLELQWKIFIEL